MSTESIGYTTKSGGQFPSGTNQAAANITANLLAFRSGSNHGLAPPTFELPHTRNIPQPQIPVSSTTKSRNTGLPSHL